MKLPEPQIREALKGLRGWDYKQGRLRRAYRFPGFLEAWDFMAGCALIAHNLNHHPSWCNSYNRVEIELWTQDVSGVTELDLLTAREFEALAGQSIPGASDSAPGTLP